jgi:signal transduction histidine kinase
MSSTVGRRSSHRCDVTLLSHVGSLTSLPARRRAHAPTSPDRARVEAAAAQAVDAERARTRAWLHDTLLQQLEFIAAGGYADVADAAELMRVAAGAATELRSYVEDSGRDGEGSLVERLRCVIADEQLKASHEIRLVFGDVDGTVEGPEGADLVAATREALTNVRKHASATQAVVLSHIVMGVATVMVRDDGVGFDPSTARRGSGLRDSIVGRMARSGGVAIIDSRPGEGTCITLKAHVPLPWVIDSAEEQAA